MRKHLNPLFKQQKSSGFPGISLGAAFAAVEVESVIAPVFEKVMSGKELTPGEKHGMRLLTAAIRLLGGPVIALPENLQSPAMRVAHKLTERPN